MNKYKAFVLYFEELNKHHIPFGMSELKEKAQELNLEIPKM